MSTVSWGAAFPTEWPRKRIKYLCRFAGGGTPQGEILFGARMST